MAAKKKQELALTSTSELTKKKPKSNEDKTMSLLEDIVGVDNMMDISLAKEGEVLDAVDVISTGSYVLDDALGTANGIPCGRIVQLYGMPSSGKTLAAMLCMKQAQIKDPTAKQLYIDAEQTFDREWARKLGLDPSKIIVVSSELAVYGQRAIELLVGIPKQDAKTKKFAGKAKLGILDLIASGELNINFIVLDSLGALIPPGEDVAEVGKMGMALMARFLTTAMKKLSIEVHKANVPMIVINHFKNTMDQYSHTLREYIF
jgi:recombination protein RecA